MDIKRHYFIGLNIVQGTVDFLQNFSVTNPNPFFIVGFFQNNIALGGGQKYYAPVEDSATLYPVGATETYQAEALNLFVCKTLDRITNPSNGLNGLNVAQFLREGGVIHSDLSSLAMTNGKIPAVDDPANPFYVVIAEFAEVPQKG